MKDTINLAISGLERASEWLPTDEAMALFEVINRLNSVQSRARPCADYYVEICNRLSFTQQLIEARAESEVKEEEWMDIMDIYSPTGSELIFSGFNGTDYDQKHAREFLKVGEVYTLLSSRVGSCSTAIRLKEFPDKSFNSVMFKNKK